MECKYVPDTERSIEERYPKIKWFEKEPNNSSAIRIFGMISMILGGLLAVSGVVMGFLAFFQDKWDAVPIITMFLTVGGGAVIGGDFAKSIQGAAENHR